MGEAAVQLLEGHLAGASSIGLAIVERVVIGTNSWHLRDCDPNLCKSVEAVYPVAAPFFLFPEVCE